MDFRSFAALKVSVLALCSVAVGAVGAYLSGASSWPDLVYPSPSSSEEHLASACTDNSDDDIFFVSCGGIY